MLALVLDLARRLSQANPSLDDPLSEGHAVVLIDEIDLHLHPKWQRQMRIDKLTSTFPNMSVHRNHSLTADRGEDPRARMNSDQPRSS